jgi:hypothetical protein
MGEEQSVLSSGQVILWWEWRRLLYNLLLLLVGFASIAGFFFLMDKAIPPGEDAEEPAGLLLGVIAYAILVNLCYTLGSIVELIGRGTDPSSARERGKKTFRVGLAFSCLLTTAPFWSGCLYYILRSTRAN